MAEQNINTNITATANFSALTAQLQAVTSELVKLQATTIGLNKNLSNQVGVMNKSFAETLRSTGQFSTHFVTLTSDVEKFGKNLDSGRMKLGQYFNTWQQHASKTSSIVKDLAKQQVLMEQAVIQPLGKNAQGLMQYNVHIAQGLDEIKNKTALARQEAAIMNKVIQQGANQMINWGKNTQWAGRQLTVGLTVPMAAFGAASAKAFREADQELVRLTKVYGGVSAKSAEELKKIREDVSATAKELAASYGVSYKETIGLAADIAATGKEGNDLIQSTIQTSRLAVLGEVDKQEAMKATLAIQNAFKQNTEELTQSIDFLNAVENQTSTTLGDLITAIPKAGPVVKALGGDVKDLALYLAAMKEGGINASEGANAIKSAMASLINPTNVAIEMFQGFGIDLGGIVQKNAGDLTGTILALQSALDSLDPLSKSKAIEQLFGKFQFARMSALFDNLGRSGSQTLQVMDLMKASTTDLANISKRELAQLTESASGKYKRALESVRADMAAAGESFLKISTFILQTVDAVVKFVDKLPGPIKSLLTLMGGLTALAGPLLMLTGVLANFFGYVIKGVFHLKNLFKGGDGFKLLTPEIMAASKAGTLLEQSFYSDAKATATLKDAVYSLAQSFDVLKDKALSSSVAVSTSFSTMQGGPIMQTAATRAVEGERMADKSHPLVGKPYSRQMAHMVPAATDQPGTIFGTVPNPGPVNVRIGKNPQMYATGDMPKVNGLTSINGVSTGVVAEAAAKWHAMTAAIATQSEGELALLKTEVAATGTITSSLSDAYQTMLPPMMELTSLAAQESQMIVTELQAGKITVETARAKIIELNLVIEKMMAESATIAANSMGRGINLTTVPLTGQSVIGPGGKSNMKELFHKGSTATTIDTIARNLGVRTSGGGFSIETTVPKGMRRFATGGYVPGTGNADTHQTSLPSGSFVVNKKSSEKFSGVLSQIGTRISFGGGGDVPVALTPGEFVADPQTTAENRPVLEEINNGGARLAESLYEVPVAKTVGLTPEEVKKIDPSFKGTASGYQVKGTSGFYIGDITDPAVINEFPKFATNGVITVQKINKALEEIAPGKQVPIRLMEAAVKARKGKYRSSTEQFLYSLSASGLITELDAKRLSDDIHNRFFKQQPSTMLSDKKNPLWSASDEYIKRGLSGNPEALAVWDQFSSDIGAHTNSARRSTTARSLSYTTDSGTEVKVGKIQGGGGDLLAHSSMPKPLKDRILKAGVSEIAIKRGRAFAPRRFGRANGGMVGEPRQGYKFGGQIGKLIGSGILSSAGFMGGNMLGSMVGGDMGGMIGGMLAAQMLGGIPYMGRKNPGEDGADIAGDAASKLPNKFTKSFPAMEKMSAKLATLGSSGGKFAGVLSRVGGILSRLPLLLNPVGIGIGVVTAAVALGMKRWSDHNEHLRIGMTQYSLTAEAAQKAGLKFTDYNQKMKTTIEDAKALREANSLVYDSMMSAKLPIEMTIEEYKKLRKEVKSTYADQIKLINQTSGKTNLENVASDLKSQLIAAGLSADEATKKIYAMFKVSEKGSAALASTVKSSSFNSITDAQTTAKYAVSTYARSRKQGGREGAGTVQTAMTAMDTAVQEAIDKSRKAANEDKSGKKEVLTQLQAELQVTQEVNKAKDKGVRITEETISELEKTNPYIREFASTQDTVISLWQKIRLQTQGYAGDLSRLNAEQVSGLVSAGNSMQSSIAIANENGLLKKQYGHLADLEKKQKALMSAAKGQSAASQIKTRDAIKALQKEIDLNNKLADARLKALDIAKTEGDLAREIEKAKLGYNQAVATGDTAKAQQYQLDIKGYQSTMQYNSQVSAIENARDAANVKPQAKIDALNNKNEKLNDNAAIASEGLSKFNDSIVKQKKEIDDVNGSMLALAINAFAAGKDIETYVKESKAAQKQAAVVSNNLKVAGIKVKDGMDAVQSAVAQFADPKNGIMSEITKGLKNAKIENVFITGNSIKMSSEGSSTGYVKTAAGESFGVDAVKFERKDGSLKEVAKTAATGKQTRQYTAANGAQYWIFEYAGKTYAVEKDGGKQTHSFKNNEVGPVVRAGKGTMKLNPRIPTIVGDEGPEMAYKGMIIPNISSIPYASPRFDIKKANLSPVGASSSGGAQTLNYTQHIHAAPGMNEDQLIRKAGEAAVKIFQSVTKNNVKMVGESKNIKVASK